MTSHSEPAPVEVAGRRFSNRVPIHQITTRKKYNPDEWRGRSKPKAAHTWEKASIKAKEGTIYVNRCTSCKPPHDEPYGFESYGLTFETRYE